uniref:Uncharacterized protein n=1 Tax=Picea glauca TaxID=3330 RepID=A0A124GNQ8_PICGL|nr:hypothetical protein ABT39_MTgene2821 [Picea glauca]QHR87644.1 hypothetical protein Q903MT_gene1656 [Picea sitchensis]
MPMASIPTSRANLVDSTSGIKGRNTGGSHTSRGGIQRTRIPIRMKKKFHPPMH